MSLDYGAAVSQKGFDVKTCDDRFLVYSSAFRTLKIANTYSVTSTIPASEFADAHVITITHNLGYFAPVIVVYNGSTTRGVSQSFTMSEEFSHLDLRINANSLDIVIAPFFDAGISNYGDTVYFTVYSFIETFDTYAASVINSGTTSGSSSTDYGFRISKEGFDVKTCADVDCMISSSFSTNIVHKKGTNTSGTVSHDLGYIPSFLSFVKNSGEDFLRLSDFPESITTSSINFTVGSGETYYYIIFKSKIV
jgi:hypothetical protein